MMKCMLTSSQYGSRPYCLEGECPLWQNENCMIATALKLYIMEHTPMVTIKETPDNELLEQLLRAQAKSTMPKIDYYKGE